MPDDTETRPDDVASDEPARSAEEVLGVLRTTPNLRWLLRGFGPLVLAVALLVAMVLFAPSVAPERVVERPVDDGTETTEVP